MEKLNNELEVYHPKLSRQFGVVKSPSYLNIKSSSKMLKYFFRFFLWSGYFLSKILKSEFKAVLESAGFEILKTKGYNTPRKSDNKN